MRVMISQPIAWTDEKQIRERAKVIAELESQGHEVWGEPHLWGLVPKYVNEALWQFGHKLQDMAGMDAVYFMEDWEKDRFCRLEYEVAIAYKIPIVIKRYEAVFSSMEGWRCDPGPKGALGN